MLANLKVSQLRKCVDDDAKDNVESNGVKEDEKGLFKQCEPRKVLKVVDARVALPLLRSIT